MNSPDNRLLESSDDTPTTAPDNHHNVPLEPAAIISFDKPRLWTVFVTLIVATGIYFGASVLSIVAMTMINMASDPSQSPPEIETMLNEFAQHPAALWVLVFPGQLAILMVTIAATLLSPEKFTQRLSLQPPRWPFWVTLAASAAAPFVSFLWSFPLSFVVTSSEHLEFLMTLFKTSGQGLGIIGLFLCVSILPAISEEWLFRGYIQTRLLKRWHPAWAILISSLLFAGFHMDPVHIVAVIPLGIWLGIVTYYSGSLIPAMIAHAYNNALSIVATVYLGSETMNTSFVATENIIVLASGAPGLLLTLVWMAYHRPTKPIIPTNHLA